MVKEERMVVSESCPILGQQRESGHERISILPAFCIGTNTGRIVAEFGMDIIRWNNTRRIAPVFGTDEQY